MKDYYKILGVEENATLKDIKKAYRKLSKQYHPDVNPNNQDAAEKFKEVNEANTVLSDETKRKEYDYKRKNPQQQNHGFGGFYDPFDDIVNNFMNHRQQARNEPKLTVPLSLKEVLKGGSKRIIFNKKNICNACQGSGKEKVETCPVCHGMGMVSNRQQRGNAIYETITPCYHCHGTGHITSGDNCKQCGGKGFYEEQQDFNIEIPIGVPYGVVISVPGRGNNNGNLNVIFIPDNTDIYERSGDDLVGGLLLSYPELLIGVEKTIDTIDGAMKLKIDKLSKPNDKIRLKGLGLPNYHHHGRGDLYLILQLKPVNELTKSEEKILQSLLQEKNFKS